MPPKKRVRVSFSEEPAEKPPAETTPVQGGDQEAIELCFGLLKVHGIYSKDVCKYDIATKPQVTQPHCSNLLVAAEERTSGGLQEGVVVARLSAEQEGPFDARFSLAYPAKTAGGGPAQVEVQVTALVLGEGKGTPLLRDSVHCLGYSDDAETDDQLASPP
ncbi:hypothetical protein WJX72_002424 [[Myrmecia] bisecta]|uniref:Adipose-secreted signaling protein n=1 Tax=[Myrmecia] bisecta TaxID=41462 RepID=A0AAW1PSB4_9CHLO